MVWGVGGPQDFSVSLESNFPLPVWDLNLTSLGLLDLDFTLELGLGLVIINKIHPSNFKVNRF